MLFIAFASFLSLLLEYESVNLKMSEKKMKNIYYLLSLFSPLSLWGRKPTGKSQWVYSDANGKLV